MLTYQVSSHFIRLPKGSTMSDLIEDMKSKVNQLLVFFQVLCVHGNLMIFFQVELSYSDAEFRLFEVYKNKIRKVFQQFFCNS